MVHSTRLIPLSDFCFSSLRKMGLLNETFFLTLVSVHLLEQQSKSFLIKPTNHLAKTKRRVRNQFAPMCIAKAEWRHFLGQEAGVPISFSTRILHFYNSTEPFMQILHQKGEELSLLSSGTLLLPKQILGSLKSSSPATPKGLLSPPVCFLPSLSSMLPTLMI